MLLHIAYRQSSELYLGKDKRVLLPHSMLGWPVVNVLPCNTVATYHDTAQVKINQSISQSINMYHDMSIAAQSYRADKALSMDKLWRCLSLYMDYCATQATASAACVESAAADQAADESADAAAESAEQDEPDAEQPGAEADDAAAEEVASAEADDAAISEGAESAEAEVGLTADAAAEQVASAGTDTQQVDSSVTLPCSNIYDTQLHMPQLHYSL